MDYYVLGITVGVVVGLAAFVLSRWKKKDAGTCKYDERQIVGRGKAFRAGFYTLLLAGMAEAVAQYTYRLPGEAFLWDLGVLLLGIMVYVLTAIHYDAYVGLNDRPERYMRMGILFVIAMGLSAYTNLHSGREGGAVMGFLNIALALMWAIVAAALWIHRKCAQQEAEE